MSKTYSDPTASAAMGRLDKELARMEKQVRALRALQKEGRLTPEATLRARSRFDTALVRRRFDAAMAAPEEAAADAVTAS